jgi:hypothetical protein
MLSIKKTQVILATIVALITLAAQPAQAELVTNGTLTGSISNGVQNPGNSLPNGWFAGATTATLSNSPDTMDENNNVGLIGKTNFGATPTLLPNSGTWIGIARNGRNDLNENFYQDVSGFATGQSYKLSWYNANFGIIPKVSLIEPYDDANYFIATLIGKNESFSFSGDLNSLGSNWTFNDFEFSPTETSYRLSFSLGIAARSYLSIDNISITQVTAVPEPSTWVFLTIGLIAIGFQARKRNLINIH